MFFKELQIRHADRYKQGFISRYNDLLHTPWKWIKIHSEYRNLISETATSHIWLLQYDKQYLRAYFTHLQKSLQHFKINEIYDIMNDDEKMRKSPWMKVCPLCSITENCNIRHLHTICCHPTIETIRHDMLLLIESTLQKLFECSNAIHRTLGFASNNRLYHQLFNELQRTELKTINARTINRFISQYQQTNPFDWYMGRCNR